MGTLGDLEGTHTRHSRGPRGGGGTPGIRAYRVHGEGAAAPVQRRTQRPQLPQDLVTVPGEGGRHVFGVSPCPTYHPTLTPPRVPTVALTVVSRPKPPPGTRSGSNPDGVNPAAATANAPPRPGDTRRGGHWGHVGGDAGDTGQGRGRLFGTRVSPGWRCRRGRCPVPKARSSPASAAWHSAVGTHTGVGYSEHPPAPPAPMDDTPPQIPKAPRGASTPCRASSTPKSVLEGPNDPPKYPTKHPPSPK